MNDALERETMRDIARHLIPLMFLMYIFNYLDRVNVSLAALTMKSDLHLSDAVYGFGGGIFFLGYFLFEVPSNLILSRVGARLWISRIMLTWGIVSSAMIFAKSPASFYALRFLLGVAEAGFFPGMILYLTYWFPASEHARAVARFMTAVALSGLIGGPLGGILLKMHGLAGLKGWQWLFLAEGIPSILLGFATFFYLDDRPERAKWLSDEKRKWLLTRLREEEASRERTHGVSLRGVFAHPRALLLSAVYFFSIVGLYGLGLWGPLILKNRSAWDGATISFLWAIPSLVAATGMVVIGSHSDRTGERRGHVAGSACLAALGFALGAAFRSPVPTLLSLSLASLGIMSLLAPFWSLSTGFLSGIAAAGGIAMINSIGNLGGFVGPTLMGELKGATNGFETGLLALAGFMIAAGLLVLAVPKEAVPK